MQLTRGKVCQPKPGFGQPGEYVLIGRCRDWLSGVWHINFFKRHEPAAGAHFTLPVDQFCEMFEEVSE